MSNEALTVASKATVKPSGRKFVLMALADYADEAWSCFPSVAQLAEYTCQGEKTVRDHLDALEQDGIITRNRQRREDGTLGRYRFTIQRRNLPVAKFARGEKQPEPPANFATHNPHKNHQYVSSGAREAFDFDRFWTEYPNKVGKRDAEKAFERALKRVDLPELMAGLARYVAKTDDRPWCNPATWLNQDRWTDQPAQAQPRASPSQPGRGNAAEAARRRLQELQNDRRRSGTEVDDYQSAPRLISSNG